MMFVITNIKTGGNNNAQTELDYSGVLRSPRSRPPPRQAQTYPARDITFIVPWNAGGSNDVAARALDPILREHGIKIVIENVVGATGTIGMRRVASAAPDGYTIGMGTSSTLALIAQGKTPLTNAQFTHIARVSTDPLDAAGAGQGRAEIARRFHQAT